jgi:hypothetical protein
VKFNEYLCMGHLKWTNVEIKMMTLVGEARVSPEMQGYMEIEPREYVKQCDVMCLSPGMS